MGSFDLSSPLVTEKPAFVLSVPPCLLLDSKGVVAVSVAAMSALTVVGCSIR